MSKNLNFAFYFFQDETLNEHNFLKEILLSLYSFGVHKMSELNTFQIAERDLDGLAILADQLFPELYENTDKSESLEEYTASLREYASEWAKESERYHFIVIRVGGDPAGFIVGGREPMIPELRMLSDTLSIEIVYTSPQYRRNGIGRALVECLIEYARANPEIKRVEAVAESSNEPSLRINRILGFQEKNDRGLVYFTKDV